MWTQTVFWMVVITYIITISKQSTGSEICIHDSLQVSSIPTQWIGYDDSSKRMRRDINADLYSPIRISPFYSDLEVELVQKDVTKLKLYVDEAIQYTSSILSGMHLFSFIMFLPIHLSVKHKFSILFSKCLQLLS